MIVVDVNVLVYAARREFDQHEVAHAWLTEALSGTEAVVLGAEVLASTVRLLTNHKVLSTPLDPDAALAFCRVLRESPAVVPEPAGPNRWDHFERLVRDLGLRGHDIPDALLAATALDLHATLATFDRGFRRFPGLTVLVPT